MHLRRFISAAGFVVLPFTQLLAQDPKPAKNLLVNGDFATGMARWTGDGKAEAFKETPPPGAPKTGSALDGLKPLVPPPSSLPALPATPRPPLGTVGEKKAAEVDRACCIVLGGKSQVLAQSVAVPRGAKVLRATFRVRPGEGFRSDHESLGAFAARIKQPGGAYDGFTRKVPATAQWTTHTLQYAVPDNARTLEWSLEILSGTGRLYFDDFVLEAVEQ